MRLHENILFYGVWMILWYEAIYFKFVFLLISCVGGRALLQENTHLLASCIDTHRRISFDENWWNNRGLTTITACVLCHQPYHYSDVIMIRFQCLQTKKNTLIYSLWNSTEVLSIVVVVSSLFHFPFSQISPSFQIREA